MTLKTLMTHKINENNDSPVAASEPDEPQQSTIAPMLRRSSRISPPRPFWIAHRILPLLSLVRPSVATGECFISTDVA